MRLVDKVVELSDALRKAEIAHALGGAIALGYYAAPRGTVEIDANIFLSLTEYARVALTLVEIGVNPPANLSSDILPTAGIACPWDDTHIDLFFSYDEEFFEMVEKRVQNHVFCDSMDVPHELPFLSAEDLVIFKVIFNRAKDWADIESILEERPLDIDYLERWLLHLKGKTVWPRLRKLRNMTALAG